MSGELVTACGRVIPADEVRRLLGVVTARSYRVPCPARYRDDLVSAAALALVEEVQRFDSRKPGMGNAVMVSFLVQRTHWRVIDARRKIYGRAYTFNVDSDYQPIVGSSKFYRHAMASAGRVDEHDGHAHLAAVDDGVERFVRHDELRRIFRRLRPDQARLLWRIDLLGESQTAIAREAGISQSRISQKRKAALRAAARIAVGPQMRESA